MLQLLSACTLLASGCSSGLKRPIREVTAVTGTDGVQHVRVDAHSFWFDPGRILVKADVPIQLELHNHSMIIPHNFSCEAPDSSFQVDADAGMFKGSNKVRFTIHKPGEYHFFCDKDSHAKKGMSGTLVVTP